MSFIKRTSRISKFVRVHTSNLKNPCNKCSFYNETNNACNSFSYKNYESLKVDKARHDEKLCGIGGKNFHKNIDKEIDENIGAYVFFTTIVVSAYIKFMLS